MSRRFTIAFLPCAMALALASGATAQRRPSIAIMPAQHSQPDSRSAENVTRGLVERFEAEQRWREAMRARYRELIRELVDDRVLVDVPGRTTGEYRAELAAARPPAAPAFDALTELFEIAWYGGRPTGATQHQQFRQLAAAVREQVLRSIEPEREPEPARAR